MGWATFWAIFFTDSSGHPVLQQVPISLTTLGEFSPVGQMFTLGSVLKITEVAQIFGLLFCPVPIMF
jgi:hypothetical protein